MATQSELPQSHNDDENELDGCMCGCAFDVSMIASDADLPATSGGIELSVAATAADDSIDGCDLRSSTDVTADHELPPATGGVSA